MNTRREQRWRRKKKTEKKWEEYEKGARNANWFLWTIKPKQSNNKKTSINIVAFISTATFPFCTVRVYAVYIIWAVTNGRKPRNPTENLLKMWSEWIESFVHWIQHFSRVFICVWVILERNNRVHTFLCSVLALFSKKTARERKKKKTDQTRNWHFIHCIYSLVTGENSVVTMSKLFGWLYAKQ